ncbi:hypothetical protein, partial [Cronobacter sakazakii]|uniref:hypothetical protein n=1 Tax=Cronobacter sakazakii TaxID=28141 RepID=UPI001C130809
TEKPHAKAWGFFVCRSATVSACGQSKPGADRLDRPATVTGRDPPAGRLSFTTRCQRKAPAFVLLQFKNPAAILFDTIPAPYPVKHFHLSYSCSTFLPFLVIVGCLDV